MNLALANVKVTEWKNKQNNEKLVNKKTLLKKDGRELAHDHALFLRFIYKYNIKVNVKTYINTRAKIDINI